MTFLIKNSHLFTIEDVTIEHNSRMNEPAIVNDAPGIETNESKEARFCCYDDHDKYDIALSKMAIESLITLLLREAVSTRFLHINDFDNLPGQIYFMMILETCNISISMDITDAEKSFNDLKLSDYPGENVSALTTDTLKYIKIMNEAYSLPLHTGSKLFKKVSKKASEYFNRTNFSYLDQAHLHGG